MKTIKLRLKKPELDKLLALMEIAMEPKAKTADGILPWRGNEYVEWVLTAEPDEFSYDRAMLLAAYRQLVPFWKITNNSNKIGIETRLGQIRYGERQRRGAAIDRVLAAAMVAESVVA